MAVLAVFQRCVGFLAVSNVPPRHGIELNMPHRQPTKAQRANICAAYFTLRHSQQHVRGSFVPICNLAMLIGIVLLAIACQAS